MNPEMAAGFEELRLAFKAKFGRDPGPQDPVFFDPDSDVPKPVSEDFIRKEITAAMVKAGIPPDKIYATAKTGMIPTEENMDMWSDSDIAEWNAAIAEYERMTATHQ